MSLPASCSEAGGPPCTGSPSPVGGYPASEASSSGQPPFSSENSGGGFSNGNNYSPFDPTNNGTYSVTSPGAQAHDRNHNHPRVPGRCGRPGCPNPVNKAADGTESTYCSSECVVGQCREVYTSWATGSGGSSAAGGPLVAGGLPHNHHHMHAVQSPQSLPPPPPQVK
jgi:hypothetical protein